jgi:hypothetical protein
MQQSTSFNLDLIRLVIKAMGGGGSVTIKRVKGGHGREEVPYKQATIIRVGRHTLLLDLA